MKAIALVLIGLVLNVYALTTMVSTIIWEQPILTPNCGQATKFALFGYTAPWTGEYIFDTTLTQDCEDTVLIFGADKSCNNDISRSNLKSKLKVRLVAGILYQFYVGGYKDSCAKGTSVYLSSELVITTLFPTQVPTSKPTPAPTKGPTVPPGLSRPFNIDFEFQRKMPEKYRPLFYNAAARIEQVIAKDTPMSTRVSKMKADSCFGFASTIPYLFGRKVDDLLIGASYEPDLAGITASARPCSIDQAGISRLGVIYINSVESEYHYARGTLEQTIMHEILHVMGVGTWSFLGISHLVKPDLAPYCSWCYTGKWGKVGNAMIGRNPGEYPVLAELQDHWDFDVYPAELMNPVTTGAKKYLSALSVYALRDLGYEVNIDKAEPYTVSSANPPKRLRKEPENFGRCSFDPKKVRQNLEFVIGTPKPGREKEANELILRNKGRFPV